jgi:hypothetical protein
MVSRITLLIFCVHCIKLTTQVKPSSLLASILGLMGSSMEAVLMNCTALHRNYLDYPSPRQVDRDVQSGRFSGLVWHLQEALSKQALNTQH